jgi:hypothetical protein
MSSLLGQTANWAPKSKSHFLYEWRFTPTSSSWSQAPRDPLPENFYFQLNCCGDSPYVTPSLKRRWVCLSWICLASIFACVSVAVETRLLSRCLVMDVSFGSNIPTFRRHVTIHIYNTVITSYMYTHMLAHIYIHIYIHCARTRTQSPVWGRTMKSVRPVTTGAWSPVSSAWLRTFLWSVKSKHPALPWQQRIRLCIRNWGRNDTTAACGCVDVVTEGGGGGECDFTEQSASLAALKSHSLSRNSASFVQNESSLPRSQESTTGLSVCSLLLLVYYFAYSSTLKMEAVCSSDTWGSVRTTWRPVKFDQRFREVHTPIPSSGSKRNRRKKQEEAGGKLSVTTLSASQSWCQAPSGAQDHTFVTQSLIMTEVSRPVSLGVKPPLGPNTTLLLLKVSL